MPHPVDPGPVTSAPVAPAVPADHAAHDPVLVAAYAAGDATGTELEAATALVTACTACATLHRDLRLIAAALPGLPAPRRTRDFRLTPRQAASLRPAGWRRLLAPFAGPRFAFAAPLGSGLAVLGIAGILLAGTGLPLGGATAGGTTAAPAEAPLAVASDSASANGRESPAAEDGSMSAAAATAAPAAGVQGPVMAPEGSGGIAAPVAAPSGGLSVAGTDKNAAPGTDAPPAALPGAAAGGSAVPGAAAGGSAVETPVASAAAAAAAAPSGAAAAPSTEALRVTGARDQVAGVPGNMLVLLATAMVVTGVTLAGLRVLSRRIA
jgi:hypothetical protein